MKLHELLGIGVLLIAAYFLSPHGLIGFHHLDHGYARINKTNQRELTKTERIGNETNA